MEHCFCNVHISLPEREGDSLVKGLGMLIVSLTGVNHRFLVSRTCSG